MSETMPLDEALYRVLAMITGHDRVEEMASDLASGLHAAGYVIVPHEGKATPIFGGYEDNEMATWARVLPHPQAGNSDLRYLHSLAVFRRLALSPTDGANPAPPKVRTP